MSTSVQTIAHSLLALFLGTCLLGSTHAGDGSSQGVQQQQVPAQRQLAPTQQSTRGQQRPVKVRAVQRQQSAQQIQGSSQLLRSPSRAIQQQGGQAF